MKKIKTLEPDTGLVDDWAKDTYDKKLYYVNASGLVCPLPDNPKSREGIRQDFIDHFDNELGEDD